MRRQQPTLARSTEESRLNRSTVTSLYNETATRIDIAAIESLCNLFVCQVGELFEIVLSKSEGMA
jgi:putative transcriptional regulator